MAQVILNNIGTVEAGNPGGLSVTMNQIIGWSQPADAAFFVPTLLTYAFAYAPVQVEFSDLAASYNEIRRPGTFPILDMEGRRLMKASFAFRAVDRQSRGLVDIEPELNLLRTMATLDAPVFFVNSETLMRYPLGAFALVDPGSLIFWRINELSITSVQRQEMRTAGKNAITQADCQISLIENRNPVIDPVVLPLVNYSSSVKKSGGNGGAGNVAGPAGVDQTKKLSDGLLDDADDGTFVDV